MRIHIEFGNSGNFLAIAPTMMLTISLTAASLLTLLFPAQLSASEPNRDIQFVQEKIEKNILGPKMILIQEGEFMMGSPRTEEGRYEDEGPQHKVTFAKSFYIAETPITVGQFRVFSETSGYKTEAEKQEWSEWRNPKTGRWEEMAKIDWRHNNRGEISGDNFPVVHISWDDAKAYANWLAKVTNKPYRLPSEAEVEYTNRAGSSSVYWWGNNAPTQVVANLKGEFDIPENDKTWYPTAEERQYAYAHGYTPFLFKGYGDGHWGISPVASFKANTFGLYDTAGNVWEWTEDCWNGSYHGAPKDGSAWTNNGACSYRVIRGGSYYCFPRHVRSANRWAQTTDYRSMYVGFRVARELEQTDEDDF
jgi:formylglycine-generating enzyme required for sulfatase activity